MHDPVSLVLFVCHALHYEFDKRFRHIENQKWIYDERAGHILKLLDSDGEINYENW